MADAAALLGRDNIAVVIPALNEALRIRDVVEGALAHCDRVIVIDDGSDDGTSEAIADLPVTLLRHATRMGKGAGLRDGFAEALRQGALAVVTMAGPRVTLRRQHVVGVAWVTVLLIPLTLVPTLFVWQMPPASTWPLLKAGVCWRSRCPTRSGCG